MVFLIGHTVTEKSHLFQLTKDWWGSKILISIFEFMSFKYFFAIAIHKHLLHIEVRCLKKKHLLQSFELWTELVTFFHKNNSYLKEWLTNYDHSILGIWHKFFEKWIKCTHQFKTNHCKYLLKMTEFKISSKNRKLTYATMNLTAS